MEFFYINNYRDKKNIKIHMQNYLLNYLNLYQINEYLIHLIHVT